MENSNSQIGFTFALEALNSGVKENKSYFQLVREEIATYGLDNVGVKELIALIMGTKAESSFCQELALLPLNRLLSMSANELRQLGVSANIATRLEATFQLFKKLKNPSKVKNGECVSSPREVAQESGDQSRGQREGGSSQTANSKDDEH